MGAGRPYYHRHLIKRMKHLNDILTSIVGTSLLLSACNQHYPSIEYDEPEQIANSEQYDKTPLMVFVNKQDFFHITATRGTGAFDLDGSEKFKNSTFHVFAFRNNRYTGTTLSEDVDLTKSIHLNGQLIPEFNEDGTEGASRADCLLDGPDSRLGMPTKLSADNSGELRTVVQSEGADVPTLLYYSSRYQDVGYNFFGYHIDDFDYTAPGVCHRQNDAIYYDLTIDGSQDILCGYAPELTPQVLSDQYGNLGITSADKAKILNIGAYSTFAAHRDLHPVISMKHMLARLRFVAHPGDEQAKNIVIRSLEVQCPNKGRLTVAHRDLSKIGFEVDATSSARLPLCEGSADGIEKSGALQPVSVSYTDDMDGVIWHQRPGQRVGESLLLPQAEEYKLFLTYDQSIQQPVLDRNGQRQFDADGNLIARTVTHRATAEYNLRLSEGEVSADSPSYDPATGKCIFKKGYAYTIHIGVYGLQEIKVSANIDGWMEGEEINLDPDDPTVSD